MSNKLKYQNKIMLFRRRIKLTQREVAHLLGQKRTAMLSSYETGRTLPPLSAALRLGVILRVPVEFLFGDMYDGIRNEVRAEEERLSARSARN